MKIKYAIDEKSLDQAIQRVFTLQEAVFELQRLGHLEAAKAILEMAQAENAKLKVPKYFEVDRPLTVEQLTALRAAFETCYP